MRNYRIKNAKDFGYDSVALYETEVDDFGMGYIVTMDKNDDGMFSQATITLRRNEILDKFKGAVIQELKWIEVEFK